MALLVAAGAVGCRDKSRKEALANERARWEESLKDSLARYERELDEAEKSLPLLREEVGKMLERFTFVNNPREVEGYYIYTPARAGYPLSSTGVSARLAKSEAAEVIAALKGGEFSAIRLVAPGGSSVTSQTVPYDQALNYRAGGLNTVAFTGQQADTLLRFAAEHSADPLTLEFLNPSKVAAITLNELQQQTLVETGRLLESREELHRAEASIPALSRKIQRLKQ